MYIIYIDTYTYVYYIYRYTYINMFIIYIDTYRLYVYYRYACTIRSSPLLQQRPFALRPLPPASVLPLLQPWPV